jgi:hypothetical protein
MFEGWSEKVGDNRIDEGAVGTPSAYANEQRLWLGRGHVFTNSALCCAPEAGKQATNVDVQDSALLEACASHDVSHRVLA